MFLPMALKISVHPLHHIRDPANSDVEKADTQLRKLLRYTAIHQRGDRYRVSLWSLPRYLSER